MRERLPLFLVLIAFAAALPLAGQTKLAPKDLPVEHRKWLEEDVVYIITPKEKDVFLRLESDRDRALFVEAFWKQRDPDPTTEENEFRKEHYRRVQYANQNFGKDSPGPGWRSAMGRIYIILGEPKAIDKFENLYDIKPTIIWFYSDMRDLGLPNSFNVVFFKRENQGEYRLYSPLNDGPQNLLVHYMGDMTSYTAAYASLMDKEPAIGTVSLSLIPGESREILSPSIPSEILLQKQIPASSYERVKDDYADKLLKYKDIIDVDYTANYIDNDNLINVHYDPSGVAFVHYLIEPSRLTLEKAGNEYRADLEVNGIVSDERGTTVYQFDRAAPIRMGLDQFEKIKANPFSFQDVFPLVPGRYTLSILWKNKLTKAFTSLEADLLVPDAAAFWMSTPVLAHKIDRESRYRGQSKSFLFGGIQFVPTSRAAFQTGEILYLSCGLVNIPDDVRRGGSVAYTILKEGAEIFRSSRPLQDAPKVLDVLEEFPLTGSAAANYELRISVLGPDGSERLVNKARFGITPLGVLLRPWVISLPQAPAASGQTSNLLGLQYLQKNDLAQARTHLQTAHAREPESSAFARDLCRVLFLTKDYEGIKAIAQPYLGDDRRLDFLQMLGDVSRALGAHADAVAYYKDYLAHFGMNIQVLNGIGHSEMALGNKDGALYAFEKSLELNPKQDDLLALVKSLKDKK
jgi:GWxTD domain-containing protein